jgi:hypothetical protein
MRKVAIYIDRNDRRKTTRRSLPESFEEMESGLRLFCYEALISFDRSDAMILILKKILHLPSAQFKAIPDSDIASMILAIDWINLGPQTTPIIPSFEGNDWKEYFFPGKEFSNGRANVYPLADEFFNKFMEGDESQADLLLATLALRKNQEGERIGIKSRSEITRRAELFKDVNPAIKMMAISYWAGIKEYVFDLYKGYLWPDPDEEKDPELDPDSKISGTTETTTEQGEGVMFGWWGVFMELAETGVFGTLNDVHQSNFHTLCMYRTKKRKEQMDAEIQRQIKT